MRELRIAFLGREQGGEEFASFTKDRFREEVPVRGRFGSDVDGFRTTEGVGGEAGGRLNGTGGPDGKEDGAIAEGGKDFVEMKRSFAKPADVRTDFPAARTAGNF